MSTTELFRTWPTLALAICGCGLLARYALCARQERQRLQELRQEGRKERQDVRRHEADRHSAGSRSERDAAGNEALTLFGARRVWRWAWLLLLAVHLICLVFPTALLRWNQSPTRLYLLEAIFGVIGLASFGGWASALWRQLGNPRESKPGQLADSAFLSLLLLGLVSGLSTAALYRWASSWGAATLTPYLRSVLGGHPQPDLVAQLPFLARLHLVAAFAALAIFPFTRLAPALLLPAHRALSLAVRPVVAAGTAIDVWLRAHSPAALIWPEEDEGEPAPSPSPSSSRRRRGRGVNRDGGGTDATLPTDGPGLIVTGAGPAQRTTAGQEQ